MLEHVIFSIDNADDCHQQAKFFRLIDTLRATNKLKGNLYSGIGSYDGQLERCFMMLAVDFDRYVAGSGYLHGQESVLRVPSDTRQPCTLHFKNKPPKSIGTLRLAMGQPKGDFTYMNGRYWVCGKKD